MFPSPKTGEMYHPDSVVNIHKKILKDAGLEHLRFHDLRHTFATLALQNGVDVKTVSSMLGHFDAEIKKNEIQINQLPIRFLSLPVFRKALRRSERKRRNRLNATGT